LARPFCFTTYNILPHLPLYVNKNGGN